MALDFPASPTIGQIYIGPDGTAWKWDGTKWVNTSSPGSIPGGAVIQATPPVGTAGQLWWDSVGGQLYVYYNDGTSQQWVPASTVPGNTAAANNVGRNLVHNPLFNIQQRGAGGFTGSGIYTADRWQSLWSGGSQTISVSPSTDTIRAQIGDESANWQFVNAFTGGAGTSDFSVITQPIEGVRRLAGKTATVSFYAATGSGNINIGVGFAQVFGTGGSPSANTPVAGQKVVASPTWQRFSLTFALPSIAGKTLGTNGNDFTGLQFWFSSGTANANNAGSIGVQSGGIGMWGVQLEVGSVATPLEKPDPRYDLANCQRFYQTMSQLILFANGAAAMTPSISYTFMTRMRASPSVVFGNLAYFNANTLALNFMQPMQMMAMMTLTATGPASVTFDAALSADL